MHVKEKKNKVNKDEKRMITITEDKKYKHRIATALGTQPRYLHITNVIEGENGIKIVHVTLRGAYKYRIKFRGFAIVECTREV